MNVHPSKFNFIPFLYILLLMPILPLAQEKVSNEQKESLSLSLVLPILIAIAFLTTFLAVFFWYKCQFTHRYSVLYIESFISKESNEGKVYSRLLSLFVCPKLFFPLCQSVIPCPESKSVHPSIYLSNSTLNAITYIYTHPQTRTNHSTQPL